ncbi:MAG TPA: hypothetical protein VGU66_11345 [Candidatus Elarobacter sp.]|nr:hypothetical protein [Candidatus Elarobacter sp.]
MNRVARGAIRVAFVAVALSVAHDLAGVRDANAPYAVDDELIYRLFAASRAAMLAVAASLLSQEDDDADSTTLGIGLIGLAANNNWFDYSPDDPLLWPAAVANYAGIGIAFAAFLIFLLRTSAWRLGQRVLVTVAAAVAIVITLLGLAVPILTVGPWYEPTLAFRANTAYWLVQIVVCCAFVVICVRSLSARRADAKGTAMTTLAGFLTLGITTTVHGVSHVVLKGGEPWQPAAVDAVGQCVFAVMLALTAFRSPSSAIGRAARWTGFGGLIALGIPLVENYFHEQFVALHLDHIGAFGGDENGRMIFTVVSGVAFARLDKSLEHVFGKDGDDTKTASVRNDSVAQDDFAVAIRCALDDLQRRLDEARTPGSFAVDAIRLEMNVWITTTPAGTVGYRFVAPDDTANPATVSKLVLDLSRHRSDA